LRRAYANTPTKDLAAHFSRPICSVYSKAGELGLKKSREYLKTKHSGRLNVVNNSIGTRFKVGNKPHNAGIKGWNPGGNSKKNRFKPGSKPHNYLPIGSERVSAGNILQRKVTDTGKPRDWVSVQALLWREQHGDIPKGSVVVLKRGSNRDVRIENLELITRAENMRRNSIHQYPEELKKSIRMVGKLKRAIYEKQS